MTQIEAQQFPGKGRLAVDLLKQRGHVFLSQFVVKFPLQGIIAFIVAEHVEGEENQSVEDLQFAPDCTLHFSQRGLGQHTGLLILGEHIQPEVVEQ